MAEGIKLTPLAKGFIAVVVLAVVAFSGWHYFGDQIRCWSNPERCTETVAHAGADAGVVQPEGPQPLDRSAFDGLGNAPADPGREGVTGVTGEAITGGSLDRPLRVGINTWAGHAPGVVANLGLAVGQAQSIYKRVHGIDVEFRLIDDPAAKFAAFQSGDIDIMWDTVDSWAREASVLAEGTVRGKAIIMQDWSRGGDGIVSLASIRSVEDLAGKRIATTEFTPSHWLLLYLLSQSGLSAEQKAQIERNLVITQDAPAAAAMFKAGRVDAAVTWEPDLSGAVAGSQREAHILVSTTAATNVIADVLVARQEIIDRAPVTLAKFVAGWFEGIEYMRTDPGGSNEVIARSLNLDTDTVSGMLSGLKLTPFADNALFFGLTGDHAHFETLFDTAFRIWRRKGVVTRAITARDQFDARFVRALGSHYSTQRVEEPVVQAHAPSPTDVPILNRTLSINFTPNSADIMPGSFFTLDSLGETMVSFGGTILRIEGNTDATGARQANIELSRRRAEAVRDYLVRTFSLPAERFQTLGQGPDNPVADNSTEAGRQLNRRTDIKVVLAAP